LRDHHRRQAAPALVGPGETCAKTATLDDERLAVGCPGDRHPGVLSEVSRDLFDPARRQLDANALNPRLEREGDEAMATG
jgi:hypothetical protein